MPELMIHCCKFSSNWQLSVANYLNIKIKYLLEAIKKKKEETKEELAVISYIIKSLTQTVHPISKIEN